MGCISEKRKDKLLQDGGMIRTKPPKPKKCKFCRKRLPEDQPRMVLHPECQDAWISSQLAKMQRTKAKAEKAAAAVDRRETRARLDDMKSHQKLLKEAKTAMQQLRRLEELAKGRGCMSCLRSQAEVQGTDSWKPGGFWDGGHYLSKGAYPELALEPKNLWLQCKKCNGGSSKYARKGHIVNQSFRANLIEQEGLELVEWLEGPHKLKHYTKDDLIIIKLTCNASSKTLKAAP